MLCVEFRCNENVYENPKLQLYFTTLSYAKVGQFYSDIWNESVPNVAGVQTPVNFSQCRKLRFF